MRWHFLLYIPFWLYSSQLGLYKIGNMENFTFHSGYIQVRGERGIVALVLNFTFHSGYIQVKWEGCISRWNSTLYIPFWLYSSYNLLINNNYMVYLYIPFWLYSSEMNWDSVFELSETLHSILVIFKLYSRPETYEVLVNFTFHSGYIQVHSIPFVLARNNTLHSILVIFKSNSETVFFGVETVFTFHSGYIQVIYSVVFYARNRSFTFHSGYIQVQFVCGV